jgi:hypothetical protein
MEPVQRWIEQIERLDDLRSRVTRQTDDPQLTPSREDTYEEEPTADSTPTEADSPDLPDAAEATPTNDVTPPPLPTETEATPGPDQSAASSDTADTSAPNPQSEANEPVAPPVLDSVSSQAADWAPPGARHVEEGTPSVNAPASTTPKQMTLAEFAEQWLAQPPDTSFRAQLDRRLLLVLADNFEEARRPLEMVSNEQQKMAGEFVEALIAIRESHGGDPGGEASRALVRIEALMESLVPLSDLRIPTLALTRSVRGFGRYETFEPPELSAGRENEFVVYCEIGNFVSRPAEAGGYESHFSMRTAILNRAGDIVLEINDDHIADQCRTRRNDCFIPRLVRLPATLSPGEYVVKVTIIDKIAGKVAERRTTFRIVARS